MLLSDIETSLRLGGGVGRWRWRPLIRNDYRMGRWCTGLERHLGATDGVRRGAPSIFDGFRRAVDVRRRGDLFRLASETRRIGLAYLFDPFSTSGSGRLSVAPHLGGGEVVRAVADRDGGRSTVAGAGGFPCRAAWHGLMPDGVMPGVCGSRGL